MDIFIPALQNLFAWVVRSSVQASVLICLILGVQILFRRRLAARWHYCLWLLVLVRMVMPWAPESALSVFNLIPVSQPGSPIMATHTPHRAFLEATPRLTGQDVASPSLKTNSPHEPVSGSNLQGSSWKPSGNLYRLCEARVHLINAPTNNWESETSSKIPLSR